MTNMCDQNVFKFNENDKAFPNTTITHLIERQCINTPDSIAVVCGKESITFQQLNLYACNFAHYLHHHLNLTPNDLVGILLDNSIEMIISLFSILKTSAAYIPIDPNSPPKRVQYMLKMAGAKALITTKKFHPHILASIPNIFLDKPHKYFINSKTLPLITHISKNTIYVLFTSGSTGNPKGAGLTHFGVTNLLSWYKDTYHFNAQDKNYVISSFGFDLAQKNILGSLISGGELHIRNHNDFDPSEIVEYLYAKKISLINCTPSAFYSLLEHTTSISQLSSLRFIFLGGEPISTTRLMPCLEIYKYTKIINTYGPTECSDISCTYCISENDIRNGQIVPIGHPIQNTKILILGDQLNILPIDAIGEIYLAGVGIGTGYINSPALTKEKFLKNPYAKKGGNWKSKLYRTGDLGYWRADGSIVCLGRTDDQVKLRGHRIELNEIDKHICSLGVKQSVTIVKGTLPEQKIISYLIHDNALDVNVLKQKLTETLPPYMLPETIIQLKQYPINIHGKIDKEKLKIRTDDFELVSKKLEPPRDHNEQILAEIWSSILARNISTLSIHDNFMELGGYSILMARVAIQASKTYKVKFPIRIFIENPTIAKQALVIREHKKSIKLESLNNNANLKKCNLKQFPLSTAQNRIWFISQLYPTLALYNLPLRYNVKGKLNKTAFKAALVLLAKIQQALRLIFINKEGHVLQTEFSGEVIDKVYEYIDISHLNIIEARKLLESTITHETNIPIDLFKHPLWKIKLFKINENTHELFFNFHHAIFDGWSWGIFKNQLNKFYNSCLTDTKNNTIPAANILDYVAWEKNNNNLQENIDYWTNKLSNLKKITLPYDINSNSSEPFSGMLKQFRISDSLHKRVVEFSKSKGFSVFQIYHSVFNLLLYLMNCGSDQVICISSANRPLQAFEDTIGFFVNTLVLRTIIKNGMSFCQLLEQNRSTFFDALDHQELPFEKLVEKLNPKRDLTKNPISQILFVFQNSANRELILDSLKCDQKYICTNSSRFELEWQMWPENNDIHLDVFFNNTLFSCKLIEHLFTCYSSILKQVIEKNIDAIDELILPKLVKDNSIKNKIYKSNVYHMFATSAKNCPNKPAVNFDGHIYSYKELLNLVTSIENYLYKSGVRSRSLVAINLQTNIDIPAIYLAILKLGATFLPMDSRWPIYRKNYILNDSAASFYITDNIEERIDFSGKVIFCPFKFDSEQLIPIAQKKQNSLAYVIYTSGSTGQPKGVSISNTALASTFNALQESLKFSSVDNFAALTSASFDISLIELLFPLTLSAQITLFSNEVKYNTQVLVHSLTNPFITVIQATPTLWRSLLNLGWTGHQQLKILCGGELLDLNLAHNLVRNSAQAWNLYGPTEACIWASTKKLNINDEIISIGQPLSHTQYMIMDESGNIVPQGVEGELCIIGQNLADEYLGNTYLTNEKFKTFCMATGEKVRLYKTGDIIYQEFVKHDFIYKGRKDEQIKISGYRVDLSEIETQLLLCPYVVQASVIFHDSILQAFVTLNEDENPSSFHKSNAWNQVFDEIYADSISNGQSTTFPGWNSRLTGKPFPEDEMNDWLDDTEKKILALRPKKILEIGCGVGQLAMRLAFKCEYYLATDISSEALYLFRKKYNSTLPENLEIRLCSADSLAHESDSFDVIIINSVIQYFPNLHYLWEVLNSLAKTLSPCGHIFIGDVRDLGVINSYKQFLIDKGISTPIEQEMLFDKKFFEHAKYELPWVEKVDILPKSQKYKNEITLFRYDVVLSKNYLLNLSSEKSSSPSEKLKEYIFQPRAFLNSDIIKEFLSKRLPTYMLPAEISVMSALPMTVGGKIDKNKLKESFDQSDINKSDDVREQLLFIWSGLLQIDVREINGSFFDQGGHSFLAITLLSLVDKKFRVKIQLFEFYANPFFSNLLEKVTSKISLNKSISSLEKSSFHQLCANKNNLPIIFCIHPIDGEIGWYKDLASIVQNDFNVIGIKQGNISTNLTVRELAKNYLALISSYTQREEIILLGWSFGASIAFEMTAMSKKLNLRIANLYLLDPPKARALSKKSKLLKDINCLSIAINNSHNLLDSSVNIHLSSISKFLPTFSQVLNFQQFDRDFSLKLLENLTSMLSYSPRKKIRKATVFFAKETISHDVCNIIEDSWNKYVDNCSIREFLGDHYQIMKSPNIDIIAKKIGDDNL